ncbi:MAG: molybdopterin-binding protein [Desulfobacterales bacterium]
MKANPNSRGYGVLRKTELRIDGVRLRNADLTRIAACTARLIGLNDSDVVVVDYRAEALTLDVLNTCIDARNIAGAENRLKSALNRLPGVEVLPDASFRSKGMLGWISLDEKAAQEAISISEDMAENIMAALSKRVLVLSSGSEVAEKQIKDTNTPTISRRLTAEGYRVTCGPTLEDDRYKIAGKLREEALWGGFRLIITTGGVGAEDKDHMVEAVTAVDPTAAAPYLYHVKIGTGRHVKDGIRIAAGECNETLIIALPGPNDEVKACLDVLVQGLRERWAKHVFADRLADHLQRILRKKTVSRNRT